MQQCPRAPQGNGRGRDKMQLEEGVLISGSLDLVGPPRDGVVGDMPLSAHWRPECWSNRALTIIIHPLTPGGNYVGHLSFYEWWRKV